MKELQFIRQYPYQYLQRPDVRREFVLHVQLVQRMRLEDAAEKRRDEQRQRESEQKTLQNMQQQQEQQREQQEAR